MEDFKELDQFKSDWKNLKVDKKYSNKEIFSMLKRKSTSAVRWIFLLSVIELVLGVVALSFIGFSQYHKDTVKALGDWSIPYEGLMIIAYIITFYFIYKFFIAFKKIKVESSVQALSKQIINFRKTVMQYIYFNLGMGLIITPFAIARTLGMLNPEDQEKLQDPNTFWAFVLMVVLVVIIYFVFIVLYFYLVYGTFLRRLKNNLIALKEVKKDTN